MDLPPAGPAGAYRLALIDAAGRRVAARTVRLEVAGSRSVVWNGRDFAGRPIPGGVYFLVCRRPDGRLESRRVVVLP